MGKTLPEIENAVRMPSTPALSSLPPANTGASRKSEMAFLADPDERRGKGATRLTGLASKARQLGVLCNYEVVILAIDRTGSAPSVLFGSSDRTWEAIDEFRASHSNLTTVVDPNLNQKQLITYLKGCKESAVVLRKASFPVGSEPAPTGIATTTTIPPPRTRPSARKTAPPASANVPLAMSTGIGNFGMNMTADGNVFDQLNSPADGIPPGDLMSEFAFSGENVTIPMDAFSTTSLLISQPNEQQVPSTPQQPQRWRSPLAFGGMASLPPMILV